MARCYDDCSDEKRAANRAASPEILKANGIAFSSSNAGAHLVVDHFGVLVDFWPGTGLWHVRSVSHRMKGRGVFPLVRYLKRREPAKCESTTVEMKIKEAEKILADNSTPSGSE